MQIILLKERVIENGFEKIFFQGIGRNSDKSTAVNNYT